jgi:hypothetical protein
VSVRTPFAYPRARSKIMIQQIGFILPAGCRSVTWRDHKKVPPAGEHPGRRGRTPRKRGPTWKPYVYAPTGAKRSIRPPADAPAPLLAAGSCASRNSFTSPLTPPSTSTYLDPTALLEQRPLIRNPLRARGVLPADLDDLTQDTVLGAWRSMRAGRFRRSPALPPADSLRLCLAGIVSRQAAHYRDKAYRRHGLPGRP